MVGITLMDMRIEVVGRGSINDHKSKLRITLTSENAESRQLILSMAGLLTGQGGEYDAAEIAKYFGITAEEVALASR